MPNELFTLDRGNDFITFHDGTLSVSTFSYKIASWGELELSEKETKKLFDAMKIYYEKKYKVHSFSASSFETQYTKKEIKTAIQAWFKESDIHHECYDGKTDPNYVEDFIEYVFEKLDKIYSHDYKKDVLDIKNICYDHQSMGCGLEDLNIIDRYEAMEYGFNEAIRMVLEILS